MADNACFVFFVDGHHHGIDSAAQALAERGLSVKRETDELFACFPGKPVVRVAFADDQYVQEEAKELSLGTTFSTEMAKCNARFEILLDDLDAVLDEINTLIDVQHALQQLTHGFLYLTWNGKLFGPEQEIW
jgi:hypothetical protein